MVGGPEIERIAFDAARGLQAAEDILGQIDREAAILDLVRRVKGTGTTKLLTSLEGGETAEFAQHLFDRDLTAQPSVIDERSLR